MIAHQEKQHLWKLVVDRKNRLQLEFQSSVKKRNKFTPIKDSSMENSKIFSRSRQRSHDSISGSRHKMNDSVMHRQYKNIDKMMDSANQRPQVSVLVSNISSNTLPRNNQHHPIKLTQSLTLHKQNNMMQNNAFKQLQKEFKQFKQNVYKQLQRQQQVINKMIKQIVFSFQYELNKLKQAQNIPLSRHVDVKQNDFVTPMKQKIKTLEEVKADLNKNNSVPLSQKIEYTNKKSIAVQVEPKMTTDKKKLKQNNSNNVNSNQLKFDKFFELMNKLKSDVNQIHQIGMLASPATSPRGQQNNNFFIKNNKQKTNEENGQNFKSKRSLK